MNEWETINQEIERSRIKRFPYKKIFGITLTKKITELKINGLTKEAIFETIKKDLKDILTEEGKKELYPKVWISICARIGEQKSYIKNIKR